VRRRKSLRCEASLGGSLIRSGVQEDEYSSNQILVVHLSNVNVYRHLDWFSDSLVETQ